MSISLKALPNLLKSPEKVNLIILNSLKRDNSIEKPQKYISLKNLFYKQENPEKNKSKINSDLPILNYITIPSDRKNSVKTAITYSKPEFNYNLCNINKYDENLDSSLSFISEFDLEKENEKSLNESFISSDEENNCEEQIQIKSSTKRIFIYDNEENDIEFENEWKDIKESLLSNNK